MHAWLAHASTLSWTPLPSSPWFSATTPCTFAPPFVPPFFFTGPRMGASGSAPNAFQKKSSPPSSRCMWCRRVLRNAVDSASSVPIASRSSSSFLLSESNSL